MEVIRQKLASIKGKFGELSKTKKIVIGIISFSVIASLIYLIIHLNTTTLFCFLIWILKIQVP